MREYTLDREKDGEDSTSPFFHLCAKSLALAFSSDDVLRRDLSQVLLDQFKFSILRPRSVPFTHAFLPESPLRTILLPQVVQTTHVQLVGTISLSEIYVLDVSNRDHRCAVWQEDSDRFRRHEVKPDKQDTLRPKPEASQPQSRP